MANFNVFKNKNGSVLATESDFLYEGISAKSLTKVGEFEADGVSDFNWGMVNAILRHSEDPEQIKEARHISENGL